jgi:uncharacterized membrane protein HdeD (DUF308 family)
MIRLLIQNWWLLLVRGIFAVAFAVFVFLFLPLAPAPLVRQLAFAGLVVVFALFAIVSGIITLVAAVRGAGRGGAAWLLLADGVAVTAGGLLIALTPWLTLEHLIQVIAMVALLIGLLEIAAGMHLRRHITDEWLLISSGVISAAFAASLLLTHAGSTQTVLTWTALYAFASGLAMTGFSLRLRSLRHSIHTLAVPAIPGKAKRQPGAA